jgi:Domain of unknown function (DUF4365)/Protein of unknown function C-terminus (DUF2399)
MGLTSDGAGEAGIHGIGLIIVRDFGWVFHAQRESDWGIDAFVEVTRDGRPTGEMFALQIKAGDARVSELRKKSRWRYYGRKKHHLSYWLAFQMQVIVVLYDQEHHRAYWQPVNEETTNLTLQGFTIDVPMERRFDPDAKEELRALANQWVPHRGSSLDRVLREVGLCRQLGIPVPPTTQLWDHFALHHRDRGIAAFAYGLPLVGAAPCVPLMADQHQPVQVSFEDLRGLWSVPAETKVFVSENMLAVEVAARELGNRSHGIVALGGFPSIAVRYLLVGLNCAGASLYLHTDHDSSGERIADSLLMRNVTFDPWCPNPAPGSRYEEECLPWMLRDMAKS